MVEGGARIIQAFLDTRLVDLLLVTIAPVLVGSAGVPAVAAAGPELPTTASVLYEQFGRDVFSFAATSALVALAAASPLGAAPSPTGSVTNQPLPADSSVGSLIGSFLSLIKGWAGAAGSAHGQGHGYGRIALPTFLDAPAISGLEEIEDYLKFA
ncbi:hypothetical protein IWQ56_007029, partial [Coemansia nantahalensis]